MKYTLGYALGAAALTALLAMAASNSAQADDIKPAVVFDMGGKFDKSFNEGVYDGVERFKKETGIPYVDFESFNTLIGLPAVRAQEDAWREEAQDLVDGFGGRREGD